MGVDYFGVSRRFDAILNLIGLFAVFMTDSGYIEDDIYHYISYLLVVAATMLVVVGISIMW